jgi:hypothetical protein
VARLIHYAIGDYARPAPGRSVLRNTAGRSTQQGLLTVRPATEGAIGCCRTRMGPGSRLGVESEDGARHRSGQADVDVTSDVP